MHEVLVIHHDRAVRESWRIGLAEAGCKVVAISRPRQAFRGLRYAFKIILTGYQFPDGMNGIEFARAFRECKTGMALPNVPIVLLTRTPLPILPEGVTAILPETPEMDGFANIIALLYESRERA